MILDRYIFKELLKSQIIVLIVLIAIFAGQSIIRLVMQAAIGDVPAALIFQFMMYALPEFLNILMPLTLYIALIITFGRICSDSEMVVMRAIGMSPVRMMFIAMILGLCTAVTVTYVSLVVAPAAANASYELEGQAMRSPEFLPIDSGRFVSFGRYNIYVEQVARNTRDNKEINNIYVIDAESPNNTSITVSQRGALNIDQDGIRWLSLQDGHRYEITEDGTFRRAQFEDFRAPLAGNVTDSDNSNISISRKSSLELLHSDNVREQVEFQWRISSFFAVFVLSMVAVPLSMVNPRQGRFARLMPAIVIYAAYYLFLLSLRNFIITGVAPLYPGLYIVPFCFLLFVAIPLNMPKVHLKHIRQKRKLKKVSSSGK